MIISKWERVLSVLLLIACLLAGVGCKEDAEESEYAHLFTEMQEAPAAYDRCLILLPTTHSAALLDAARAMAERLEARTGIDAQAVSDGSLTEDPEEKILQILLGTHTCEASYRFLKDLRFADYGYEMNGNTLVIAGHTEQSTMQAMDLFYREVLPYADRSLLLPDGTKKVETGEYAYESVTLQGFSLAEYTLVYDKEVRGAEAAAQALWLRLGQELGYGLAIREASEKDIFGRMLHVGDTGMTDTEIPALTATDALICSQKNGVLVYGTHPVALMRAAMLLCDSLQIEENYAALPLEAPLYGACSYESLSMLCVQAEVPDPALAELLAVRERIRTEQPMLVRLAGYSAQTVDRMALDICNGQDDLLAAYRYVTVSEQNVTVCYVYRSDAISVTQGESIAFAEGSIACLEVRMAERGFVMSLQEILAKEKTGAAAAEAWKTLPMTSAAFLGSGFYGADRIALQNAAADAIPIAEEQTGMGGCYLLGDALLCQEKQSDSPHALRLTLYVFDAYTKG